MTGRVATRHDRDDRDSQGNGGTINELSDFSRVHKCVLLLETLFLHERREAVRMSSLRNIG